MIFVSKLYTEVIGYSYKSMSNATVEKITGEKMVSDLYGAM